MKKLIILLVLGVASMLLPIAQTGCTTAPSARSVQVVTLKVLGATVDASMKAAAQLRHEDKITAAQWQQIADLHDNKYQPAYALAVIAVQADLSSVASPDLAALGGQIVALIGQFQTK